MGAAFVAPVDSNPSVTKQHFEMVPEKSYVIHKTTQTMIDMYRYANFEGWK